MRCLGFEVVAADVVFGNVEVAGIGPGEPGGGIGWVLLWITEPEHAEAEDAVVVVGVTEDLVHDELFLRGGLGEELLVIEGACVEDVEAVRRGAVCLLGEEVLDDVDACVGLAGHDLEWAVPLEEEFLMAGALKQDVITGSEVGAAVGVVGSGLVVFLVEAVLDLADLGDDGQGAGDECVADGERV